MWLDVTGHGKQFFHGGNRGSNPRGDAIAAPAGFKLRPLSGESGRALSRFLRSDCAIDENEQCNQREQTTAGKPAARAQFPEVICHSCNKTEQPADKTKRRADPTDQRPLVSDFHGLFSLKSFPPWKDYVRKAH